MLDDHTIGCLAVAIATGFMAYYTAWMIGMPFVDPEHFSQALFPPKVYGLVLPSVLGALVLVTATITGSIIQIRKVGLKTLKKERNTNSEKAKKIQ